VDGDRHCRRGREGGIIGGMAVAEGQLVAVGAAALVTILTAHYLVVVGRFHPLVARLVDHLVRVLVDHGRLRPTSSAAAA
jgi:hypothetical protein